jgi:hypothetical protein
LHSCLSCDAQSKFTVLIDRMLVRVSYTKSECLGNHFDEKQNRTTCNTRYEDWDEFMVVWRQNRIEIYENYVRLN